MMRYLVFYAVDMLLWSAALTVGSAASSLSGQLGWWLVHRALLEAGFRQSVCLFPALLELAPGLAPS